MLCPSNARNVALNKRYRWAVIKINPANDKNHNKAEKSIKEDLCLLIMFSLACFLIKLKAEGNY